MAATSRTRLLTGMLCTVIACAGMPVHAGRADTLPVDAPTLVPGKPSRAADVAPTAVPLPVSTGVSATLSAPANTPAPVALPTLVLAPPPAVLPTTTPVAPVATPLPTAASSSANANITLKPGDLDPNFGKGGVLATKVSGQLTQLTPFGRDLIYAFTVSRICPSLIEPCTDTLVIARFKANGTLDEQFSQDGQSLLTGQFYGFTNVLVLPDGKFIVGVGALPQSRKPGLLRLSDDGQADRTFGSDGQAISEVTVGGLRRPLQPMSLALQTDGKIVVTGSERSSERLGSSQHYVIARFNRNGQPDVAFGKGGVIRHSDLTSVIAESFGTQVFVQPTGHLVTLGRAANLDGFATFVYQFNSNGRQLFPSTFTKNTLYALSPECQNQWLNMRMHPDGKFSMVRNEAGASCEPVYYRVNADLSLDSTAAVVTDGVPLVSVVQPDGKLVGVGRDHAPDDKSSPATMAVFRYNERGAPDATFGVGGVATATVPLDDEPGDFAASVATVAVVQLDGMILVGGTYTWDQSSPSTQFVVLARFVGRANSSARNERWMPVIMNR